MIFWEKLKIQTGNGYGLLSFNGSQFTLDKSLSVSGTVSAQGLNLETGFEIPAGTTFESAVTLPAGSGITNVLTKQGNNGYTLTATTATLSSLSANTGTITSVIASGITNNGSLRTESATINGNLTVNGSVTLPTNTTIGGGKVTPGPRQSNILKIDGHFEKGDDWVSVDNLSVSPIYIYVQLYQDAAYKIPYLANGQPVSSYTSTPIAPGSGVKVLYFTDPSDQFYAMNGYVRIKYSLTEVIDSANKGNDLNKQIRATNISGYNREVYAVYDPSTAPAPWLRTVLYESDNEYWYVVNCSTSVLFANMRETMRAAPYYCNYVMIHGGEEVGNGGWQSWDTVSHFYGGVIGFKSVDE